jgi:hypothetical protein
LEEIAGLRSPANRANRKQKAPISGARITPAERETSISALVKCFLMQLTSGGKRSALLEGEERELRARIDGFKAGDWMSRDDAHRRGG